MRPKRQSSTPTISDVRRPSFARLIAFWAVLLFLVLFAIEAGAAAATYLLLKSGAYFLFWNPDPDVVRASWNAAMSVDPTLGWPPPSAATSGERDASGAKYNVDFPDPREACASAYGDSFVWGNDVPQADGWIEQLARKLGCRVSNYGVGGYGVDQAYIRFQRMTDDNAPIVLLGIFPDDIVRTVNQYRALIGFAPEPVWVKGRFVLDQAGALQWIERPRLDANSYLAMHREPAVFLPHEYLLPDTHDGPVSVRFPFTATLARVVMAPRIWNRLRQQTPWSDFYSPNHPSGAVPLTVAIVAAFMRDAEQRGKQVFIVMLPGAGSFRVQARFGKTDYAPFVNAMAAKGLDVFDPAPGLLATLKGRSYCILYVQEAACQGHFGVAGSILLADVVANELKRRKLIKK